MKRRKFGKLTKKKSFRTWAFFLENEQKKVMSSIAQTRRLATYFDFKKRLAKPYKTRILMPASKATTTTILKVKLIIYSIRFSKKQKTKTHEQFYSKEKTFLPPRTRWKRNPVSSFFNEDQNYNVISFLHYFLDKTDISRHLRCFTDIKYVRKKRKKILAKKFQPSTKNYYCLCT